MATKKAPEITPETAPETAATKDQLVIATAPGFYGCYRYVGDKFKVPAGTHASWFKPV